MIRFKVDENLPTEIADLLRGAGHDALTVGDQGMIGRSDPEIAQVCRNEERAPVTLDLDFSDIRNYPPSNFPGIVVKELPATPKGEVMHAAFRIGDSMLMTGTARKASDPREKQVVLDLFASTKNDLVEAP